MEPMLARNNSTKVVFVTHIFQTPRSTCNWHRLLAYGGQVHTTFPESRGIQVDDFIFTGPSAVLLFLPAQHVSDVLVQ